jgi:hypothetical protein
MFLHYISGRIAVGIALQRVKARDNQVSLMTEDDTEQFRQQAEECRREAEKAITPWTREAWLKLAADWLRLAQDIVARRNRK